MESAWIVSEVDLPIPLRELDALQRCRISKQKMERLMRPENEAAKQQHLLSVISLPNILLSKCSPKQTCHCLQILSNGSLSESSVPLYAKTRFPLATASDAPSMFQRKGL